MTLKQSITAFINAVQEKWNLMRGHTDEEPENTFSSPASQTRRSSLALLHPVLDYRLLNALSANTGGKWIAYSIALAALSLISNFGGFLSIFNVGVALLAGIGLQIAISAAGWELSHAVSKRAATFFACAWLLCFFVSAQFDGIFFNSLHRAKQTTLDRPVVIQSQVQQGIQSVSDIVSGVKKADLAALGHESAMLDDAIAKARTREFQAQQRPVQDAAALQAASDEEVGLDRANQRKQLIDDQKEEVEALSFDTSRIALDKPAQAWPQIQKAYNQAANLHASIRSAMTAERYDMPPCPQPAVLGADDVKTGMSDTLGGPLSQVFHPTLLQGFFAVIAAAFELPPLLFALAFAEMKRDRQAKARTLDSDNDGRSDVLDQDDDQATGVNIDATDADERNLQDFEHRQTFVYRYGEKLEADAEAEGMLRPIVQTCRRAKCRRLENHALQLELEALGEKISIERWHAERMGIKHGRVKVMAEAEFSDFEAERDLQHTIATGERGLRAKQAQLEIKRAELGLVREISRIDAELADFGEPAAGHVLDSTVAG